jgi:murein DD-endopeptidase MepM/ murein hydrolase activator NlpD
MKTSIRARLVALCAAMAVAGALAPVTARAQVADRAVTFGAETKGGHLLYPVTASEPADGGSVILDDVDAFDPDGGLAIIEPGGGERELVSYQGVDETMSALTGLVRTTPDGHPAGSFVQAVQNASPSPEPSESPSSRPRPRDKPSPRPDEPRRDGPRDDPAPNDPIRDEVERPKTGFGKADELAPAPRSFTTASLASSAAQLHALGWSEGAARVVYRPFPVAGPATFTNTWGALRYGPAPGQIRGHEGQDIFCDFGAPILAVTHGRIQFDTNGLGGRIARLRMRDGSYWYYAHLSGWNRAAFSNGDAVEPGDVIGYCGHSGDAKTTPNHLHLGWYSKSGDARNPMALLVGWLRTARADAKDLVVRVERRTARTMRIQTLGRMFGDSWAPDLAVVTTATPSAQPSTSPPAPPCDPGVIAPTGTEPSATCSPAEDTPAPTE